MPHDHQRSKAEFPLDKAQRLRGEGYGYGTIAKKIGYSKGHVHRTLTAHPSTLTDVPLDTIDLTPAVTSQKIALTTICLTAGTQMRESLNLATIADYAEAMAEGKTFPPIIVFTDGHTSWLSDGFQRVKAAEQVGSVEIEAEVRPGTLRDAMLFACGANATHGSRRTDPDKRKSVRMLMEDAEWSQWSDNRIAEVCGVSQTFASQVRRSLSIELSDHSHTRQYVDKHGTVTTMDTSKIGRRASSTRQTPAVEPPSQELPFTPDGATCEPGTHPARGPSLGGPILSPLARCPTCARVRTLIDAVVAQLAHLADAANIDGYAEYEDVHATLRALQRAVDGQEVGDA